MHILSLEQIKEAVEELELMDAIKEGFVAYSKNLSTVPPVGELIFKDPPGDVHIKYGYIQGDKYYVIKIASGFFENEALGLSSSEGMMLLFDQKTGEGKGILLDRGYLTNVRTAVAGAIVAEALGPDTVSCIGVLGTGTQARMQVSYLSNLTECRKVYVWGRSADKMKQYLIDMAAAGWDVRTRSSANDVARECNLIITATPSKEPLINSEAIQPGTHITAMGSDTPGKQELDTDILNMADVIVADSISQCRERGEIAHALRAGVIAEDDIVELGAVLCGDSPGRTNENQITVADLTGVAVQDIQIAAAVYNACNQEGKNED